MLEIGSVEIIQRGGMAVLSFSEGFVNVYLDLTAPGSEKGL